MAARSDKPLPISRGNSHDFLIDISPGNLSRCSSRDILAGLLPNFQKKSQFLDLHTDDVLSGFAFEFETDSPGLDHHSGDLAEGLIDADKYSPSKCMKAPAIGRVSAGGSSSRPRDEGKHSNTATYLAEIPREDYESEDFELALNKKRKLHSEVELPATKISLPPTTRPRAPTIPTAATQAAALAEIDRLMKEEQLEEDGDDPTVCDDDALEVVCEQGDAMVPIVPAGDEVMDLNLPEGIHLATVDVTVADEGPDGLPKLTGAKPSWWLLNWLWLEIPEEQRDMAPPCTKVGTFSLHDRAALLEKFREKRLRRNYKRNPTYECRQQLANKRPRIKGRFVKLPADEA